MCVKGREEMDRLASANRILNIVLGILYIPLSFFSFLSGMLSEAIIGATNPLFITLMYIFYVIALLIPVLCWVGLFLSVSFSRKGRGIHALVAQLLPLGIFLLNWLLPLAAISLPPVS